MACLISTTGCSTLNYLFQAGKGQLELFNRARPISEVIHDEHTPRKIRELLGEISSIKKFGEKNGLKPTANYTDYVKLDRPAAVWVVSACEPLRFQSKVWHFPIVGSFPYLGWFDRKEAQDFAQSLRTQGWDVDLRGASAYSTLGWFRDPILSTMISDGDEVLGGLVNVVIHESVHATIYIAGQAYFNESIANFIAGRLTLTYLDETRGPESPEKRAYVGSENQSAKIENRFYETYQQLEKLYQSNKADPEKREEKQKILDQLKSEFNLRREINNATLVQYQTYNTGKPDFESLLKECGNDWIRFLTALKHLDSKSFSKPQQSELTDVLKRLKDSHCGS